MIVNFEYNFTWLTVVTSMELREGREGRTKRKRAESGMEEPTATSTLARREPVLWTETYLPLTALMAQKPDDGCSKMKVSHPEAPLRLASRGDEPPPLATTCCFVDLARMENLNYQLVENQHINKREY